MNPEDAEEYTQGLIQIVAGARRQMEEAARLGVPQALGLSASEWAETRLGGTPKHRKPVTELAAQWGRNRRQGSAETAVAIAISRRQKAVPNCLR